MSDEPTKQPDTKGEPDKKPDTRRLVPTSLGDVTTTTYETKRTLPFGRKITKETEIVYHPREKVLQGLQEEQDGYRQAILTVKPKVEKLLNILTPVMEAEIKAVKSYAVTNHEKRGSVVIRDQMEEKEKWGLVNQLVSNFRNLSDLNRAMEGALRPDVVPGNNELMPLKSSPDIVLGLEKTLSRIMSTENYELPLLLKNYPQHMQSIRDAEHFLREKVQQHFLTGDATRQTPEVAAMIAYAHKGGWEKREMLRRETAKMEQEAGVPTVS